MHKWFNRRKTVRIEAGLLSRLLEKVGPVTLDFNLGLDHLARVDPTEAVDCLAYLRARYEPDVIDRVALSHGFDPQDVPHPWACIGCGLDTLQIGEDSYAIGDAVWADAEIEPGCFCVRCFEHRLGRRLRRDDFVAEWLNTVDRGSLSERLQSRLLR